MKTFEDYIRPRQEKLFAKLCAKFKDKTVISKGDYILVRGEAPILLIAHMDTVHKEPVKDICYSKDGNIIMSPQGIGGDDRCGVYALNVVYEKAKAKPWLLFTCDEEIGGIGAKKFAKDYYKAILPEELDYIKAIVEIDRKGADDAVYYDCDNEEFEEYITGKGFVTDWGSFSDISVIAPEMGVAAVNLSSGYYNAHTQYEYINMEELNCTITKVLSIVDDASKPDFPRYEYIEAEYTSQYDWSAYSGYNNYYYKKQTSDFLYEREYNALIDIYGTKELDKIRAEMGDSWIEYLFESEYGGSYDEIFGEEEKDERL